MSARLFESFSGMIDSIPGKAIPRAIELERWMLEDDLEQNRCSSKEETYSILSFCRFIKAVAQGESISPVALPVSHVAYYRKVVMELIEADELPYGAKERFDQTFASGFLRALAVF